VPPPGRLLLLEGRAFLVQLAPHLVNYSLTPQTLIRNTLTYRTPCSFWGSKGSKSGYPRSLEPTLTTQNPQFSAIYPKSLKPCTDSEVY
jgi:hypothetical protein